MYQIIYIDTSASVYVLNHVRYRISAIKAKSYSYNTTTRILLQTRKMLSKYKD